MASWLFINDFKAERKRNECTYYLVNMFRLLVPWDFAVALEELLSLSPLWISSRLFPHVQSRSRDDRLSQMMVSEADSPPLTSGCKCVSMLGR